MLSLTEAGVTIGLISGGMTLLSTLVRTAVLDKNVLKEQKEKLSHHKKQAGEAMKRKDVNAAQKHQQQMLEVSMEQMRHGFKPMLFTLIPFILVFQWMGATYGTLGEAYNVTITDYLPQGATFTSVDVGGGGRYVKENNVVVWNMSAILPATSERLNVSLGFEGTAPERSGDLLEVEYAVHNTSVSKVSSKGSAQAMGEILTVSRTEQIVNGNKAIYSIVYTETGSATVANIFGWELGWFGWYFISSMVSGIVFNKIIGNM